MSEPVLTAPPVPAQDVLTHVTKKEFDILLAMDQLNMEREKNKVFLQFRECGAAGLLAAFPVEARDFQLSASATSSTVSLHGSVRAAKNLGKVMCITSPSWAMSPQLGACGHGETQDLTSLEQFAPLGTVGDAGFMSSVCLGSQERVTSPSHPPTGMSGAPGTTTCGRSSRPQG